MILKPGIGNLKTELDVNTNLKEIFKIINNNNTAQDGINFIKTNFSYFLSDSFSQKIVEKLKNEKNDNNISMMLLILSFIDQINETNNLVSDEVEIIIKGYQRTIKTILSDKENIQEAKILAENSNKKLFNKINQQEEKIKILENILSDFGISTNNELIKALKNNNNLKEISSILEQNGTIKKGDDIIEIIDRLNNSHSALEKFIENLVKQGILIRTNNSSRLPSINSTALDAVNNTKLFTNNVEKEENELNTNPKTIIKGDYQKIEKFYFKELGEKDVENKKDSKNKNVSSDNLKKRIEALEKIELENKKKIEELEKKLENEKNKNDILNQEVKKQKKELKRTNKIINKQEETFLKHKMILSGLNKKN